MMKNLSFFGAVAALMLAGMVCVAADDTQSAKPDKDGFYSLFDGKSLDGWKVGDKADAWKVEDGHMVVHNGASHLFYEGPVHNHDWKDFHFKAQVMTFPHANSGIYFHTSYQEAGFPNDGFECQVNATHSDWKKTGSLYNVKDIRDPHHKDNEWFLYEIIVKGNQVTLKINGQTVNEWTQPADYKAGHGERGRFLHHGTFALQGHDPNSQTWYKDIVVKPLDEEK